MRKIRWVAVAVTVFALLSGLSASEKPFNCRVLLMWQPQAQFAGFYMAEDAGFYREAGLDVELLHAAAEQNPLDLLENGKTDFIVAWLVNSLLDAGNGRDLVQVGQLARRSGLLLVSRRELPDLNGSSAPVKVNSLADLQGRRIGLWISPSLQSAVERMLKKNGLTDFKPIDVLKNVDLFLYGGVDAINAMVYNEYFQLLCAGLAPEELRIFKLGDGELDFPEDGLYTTRAVYAVNPEGCRKLVEATLRGWQLAFADKPGALEAVRRRCLAAGVPYSEMHQSWMLYHLQPLIFPEDSGENDGLLQRNVFERAIGLLSDCSPQLSGLTFEQFAPSAAASESAAQ